MNVYPLLRYRLQFFYINQKIYFTRVHINSIFLLKLHLVKIMLTNFKINFVSIFFFFFVIINKKNL